MAQMNDRSLIHSPFEYASSSESESLEHMRGYAGPGSFVNGGVPSQVSLRPDNYGVLGFPLQHPTVLTGEKVYRYSSNPGGQDVPPFHSVSGLSMSPLESSCGSSSASPLSASSSSIFSPQTSFSTNGSTAIGSFSSAPSVAFPPAVTYTQAYMPVMYDSRPRIPSSSAGMPPPLLSQNPHTIPLPHSATARETYITSSHAQSYGYPPVNPSFISSSQHPMLTNSRSQRYNNMPIDSSHYGASSPTVPPFDNTRTILPIVDNKGQSVQIDLQAKIDKGFFKAENDWTCYRRNYFSVACSYSLKPSYQPSREPIYLQRPNGSVSNPDLIRTLAICITARVSGEENKIIDLVQHTPKRDKGPLGRPEKVKLMPIPPGALGPYSEPAALSTGSQLNNDYDPTYQASSQNPHQNSTVATFDRIQFKNATANNGKRRAAQQYFHIVVELFAEIPTSQSSEGQWVKVATKTSARMVVRGRSPGHYSDDRRSSSASMGPGGGSGGDGVGGQHEANAGGPPGGSRSGLGNLSHPNSSRLGSSTYISGHAAQHHYSSPESRSSASGSSHDSGVSLRVDRPDCPMLSPEDESAIQEHDGYQYFPAPLYEGMPNSHPVPRPHLPPVRNVNFKSEIEPPGPHHGTNYGVYPSAGGGHHTNPGLLRSSVRNSSAKSDNEPSAPSHHDTKFRIFPNSNSAGHPDPEATRSIKTENHESSDTGSHRIWPLSSTIVSPSGGRHCGRFQGVDTSTGYYPVTPAL